MREVAQINLNSGEMFRTNDATVSDDLKEIKLSLKRDLCRSDAKKLTISGRLM